MAKFNYAELKKCKNCEHIGTRHWHEKKRQGTEYGACKEPGCNCRAFEPEHQP